MPNRRGEPERAASARLPLTPLLVLALAVFTNITVEMLPMGLLLPMSRELEVGESAIGLLVTMFAFTVVLSSTTLIRLTKRVPRHTLVVSVLIIFAVSTLGSALAPNYAWVVAFRVLGGLAHGVFWTVVGAYAAYIVPKHLLARAVAITTAGGSLAFVLGLPLATLLGQLAGWRWAFGVAGLACIMVAVAVARLLPAVDHLGTETMTPTGSIAVPDPRAVSNEPTGIRGVVVVIVSTTVIMLGQYALYTYISPYLVQHVGLPEQLLSGALFAYGGVGALGVLAVAMWLGRRPGMSLVGMLSAGLIAMVLLGSAPSDATVIAGVMLWAFVLGGLPALLQTKQLQATPARVLQQATAWYTTGFNVGIGGGALLGAFVIERIGLGALPWVFGVGLALALVLIGADGFVRPRRGNVVGDSAA